MTEQIQEANVKNLKKHDDSSEVANIEERYCSCGKWEMWLFSKQLAFVIEHLFERSVLFLFLLDDALKYQVKYTTSYVLSTAKEVGRYVS